MIPDSRVLHLIFPQFLLKLFQVAIIFRFNKVQVGDLLVSHFLINSLLLKFTLATIDFQMEVICQTLLQHHFR